MMQIWCVWIAGFLLLPISSMAQGIQSAACVGDPSYPVRAIYLHGLFPMNGARDPDDFAAMEFENRKALAKIAQQLKIRIAIPLAPHVKKKPPVGMRFWDSPPTLEGKSTSRNKIESDASAACGNAEIKKPTTLIGFSNGGNMALKICEENPSAFEGKIVIIAPTRNSTSSACQKKLAKSVAHSSFEKSTAPTVITSALKSAGGLGSGSAQRRGGQDFRGNVAR